MGEQEPVVVDTEGGDMVAEPVDNVTITVKDSTETEDSPATPLIDTRGFAAVAAAVAVLEAAVVAEKPVPVETTLESADSSEEVVVVSSEAFEESSNYEVKKVIVTEATEIVDIDDAEANIISIEDKNDLEDEDLD